jgi:hypothetical protein
MHELNQQVSRHRPLPASGRAAAPGPAVPIVDALLLRDAIVVVHFSDRISHILFSFLEHGLKIYHFSINLNARCRNLLPYQISSKSVRAD